MGAVRTLADSYLLHLCTLDPIRATYLGVPGFDGELPDFSPTGSAERADLARRTVAALASLPTEDDDAGDRRCRALILDRLSLEVDQFDAEEHLRPLRVIGSPIGTIRSAFDMMPRSTEDDWMNVAARLEQVPGAYRTVQLALEAGHEAGVFAAPRQALACADQLATWAGDRRRRPRRRRQAVVRALRRERAGLTAAPARPRRDDGDVVAGRARRLAPRGVRAGRRRHARRCRE